MPSGAPQLIRRAFLCAALTSIVIPATAQADLVFSPDATPVSFGNTTVMNSTERTVTLTNTSTSTAVNINGMLINGPGANHFSTGPSLCPPTLSPSASCNLTIRFNPSQTGTFNNPQLQLQINHNASNPTPLTRQLTGTGVPANLVPSPNPVDFETVLIDDGGEPRLIQVQNAGAANAQVTQIDINGPDASAFRPEGGCMGQTISPGQNCVFPIRFEPREDRVHNATLHIRVGGADFPVALTGIGGVSQVAMAPNPLDFGNVAVGSSATATMTARSTGNAPFESIVAILSGGDVDDLRIVKDMCGLRILIPTQQCSVTLRFTPSDAGPAEAGLAPDRHRPARHRDGARERHPGGDPSPTTQGSCGVQAEVRSRPDQARAREARQGAVQGRAHLHGDRAHSIHGEPPRRRTVIPGTGPHPEMDTAAKAPGVRAGAPWGTRHPLEDDRDGARDGPRLRPEQATQDPAPQAGEEPGPLALASGPWPFRSALVLEGTPG